MTLVAVGSSLAHDIKRNSSRMKPEIRAKGSPSKKLEKSSVGRKKLEDPHSDFF
jgi:hypothetical protein